ncbi:hypothetical protein GGS20DRAFT_65354 [Poronia punctata]|nr:hypothetical protein GGS20DRAFT_65354 [Poronia punctata]
MEFQLTRNSRNASWSRHPSPNYQAARLPGCQGTWSRRTYSYASSCIPAKGYHTDCRPAAYLLLYSPLIHRDRHIPIYCSEISSTMTSAGRFSLCRNPDICVCRVAGFAVPAKKPRLELIGRPLIRGLLPFRGFAKSCRVQFMGIIIRVPTYLLWTWDDNPRPDLRDEPSNGSCIESPSTWLRFTNGFTCQSVVRQHGDRGKNGRKAAERPVYLRKDADLT